MAKTVLENLKSESVRIQSLLKDLLAHSSIHRWHDPYTSSFAWIGGNFSWTALGDEGRQVQAQILDRYRRFLAVIRVLLKEHPDRTVEKIKDADRDVLEFVQQNELLFKPNPQPYFEDATKGVAALVELLNGIYANAEHEATLVPDTNALLFNPSIEGWRFTEAPQFLMVLTAPVLSELDGLKINHRVETVRDKAERLIRQIKEYRRRADVSGRRLADGVDLVSGVSRIATLALEPRMEDSLPWLDSANKDDRILANVIEVMRAHARSPVLLVTRDINLQNKADYASVPFIEPPDPI